MFPAIMPWFMTAIKKTQKTSGTVIMFFWSLCRAEAVVVVVVLAVAVTDTTVAVAIGGGGGKGSGG
jgi:hypothetical protein